MDDQLNELLIEINDELIKINKCLDIYVTGGSAMSFYAIDNDISDMRRTHDIDYVNFIDDDELRSLLNELNTEFAGMFTDSVPVEDYYDQSTLYSFSETLSNLNVYVPRLEIIFVNKAMSTRQKDLEDCLYLKDYVDLSDCEERLREILSYQAYVNPDCNVYTLQRMGVIRKLI